MNSNAILSSDVLDILFENRNKTYGAYTLRKFYPDRIKTSLFIMIGMVAAFSAFTFLPDKKNTTGIIDIKDSLTVRHYTAEDKPEPPKPKTQPAVATNTQKLTSVITFVQKKDSADVLHDLTNLRVGSVTSIAAGEGPVDADPGLAGGSIGGTETAKPVETVVDNSGPVDNPDVQPSFPGGEAALMNFLQKNLHSPQEMEDGETIQVRVKYVVGYDGNLQSFDVVQDGGTVFNNEVIRVLKKMPKWNPGKKGGKNVPVYYCLPVKFTGTE